MEDKYPEFVPSTFDLEDYAGDVKRIELIVVDDQPQVIDSLVAVEGGVVPNFEQVTNPLFAEPGVGKMVMPVVIDVYGCNTVGDAIARYQERDATTRQADTVLLVDVNLGRGNEPGYKLLELIKEQLGEEPTAAIYSALKDGGIFYDGEHTTFIDVQLALEYQKLSFIAKDMFTISALETVRQMKKECDSWLFDPAKYQQDYDAFLGRMAQQQEAMEIRNTNDLVLWLNSLAGDRAVIPRLDSPGID